LNIDNKEPVYTFTINFFSSNVLMVFSRSSFKFFLGLRTKELQFEHGLIISNTFLTQLFPINNFYSKSIF
jgi:hypothetical protein